MRFLETKAIVRACPSCTSQNWTLQYSRSSEQPELIFATNLLGIGTPFEANVGPAPQMIPFGRPILPLICNECGYMKIHDYEVVRKWVRANPERDHNAQEATDNGRSEA